MKKVMIGEGLGNCGNVTHGNHEGQTCPVCGFSLRYDPIVTQEEISEAIDEFEVFSANDKYFGIKTFLLNYLRGNIEDISDIINKD